MKPAMRRPIAYVAGGAGLIALLVIARPTLNPTAVLPEQASNRSVTGAGPLPVVPVVDLDLDRLQTVSGDLSEPDRDPFRFRPKPSPPAPRVQAPPPVITPPAPTGPPPPPPIALKFIGVMTLGGQRVAAFGDGRGNTFTAKEGDAVEGRYRLLRISLDSVDIAYLDGRGRQTIHLTGQ
jgi:hypothetical protein